MNSLWGPDFIIPDNTEEILKKVKKPKQVKELTATQMLASKKFSLEEKLSVITSNVNRILGGYKANTLVIKTKEQLINYIDEAIKNKVIAIDTETNNSLDPFTCKLMGPCIYTPGQKNAYIPVNHVNPETGERLEWQLTETDIREQFSRLNCSLLSEPVKIITHNGKFDYKVLHFTTGWDMPIYWDTMIGARLLNENERAGLKGQYIEKIDPSIEKYSIDHLFNIEYELVDPEVFALYAATDSYMTYKLYQWQENEFNKSDNEKLFKLFKEIEMPLIEVVANMEIAGICLDTEYIERLGIKYHLAEEEVRQELDKELVALKPQIDAWRLTEDANFHPISERIDKNGEHKLLKSKAEQLHDPPELTSPKQLEILLYDILGVEVVDKKQPRGTGAEILEKIDLSICKLIIKQKKYLKLIDAFIDALPKKVSTYDNRLHAHFNQLGTDTGRFSSTDPNLQQIPSKNKELRMMFKAAPGYTFIGSDFSAQEPRILAELSQDEKLLENFRLNRDVYATIGTGVFKNTYWDNMEHHEDGTPNEDGKKRRKKCKTLLLGMSYGMGSGRIAKNMNCSLEEAQKIINDFNTAFPVVQNWMQDTEISGKKCGYVEDFYGRKRHLPDLALPEYEFEDLSLKSKFNPLLRTENLTILNNSTLIEKYKNKIYNCRSFKEKEAIKKAALTDNVKIHDNGGFISRAQRQCVNARIQGSAASMTKKAMLKIHNDKEINDLGFRLLIGVHDELIGECPIENAEKAAERLSYLMTTCVPEMKVNFKCDAEIEDHWYKNEYRSMIQDEYAKLLAEGIQESTAFEQLCKNHIESTEEDLVDFLG